MRASDVTLVTAGGLLVASGLRRAEQAYLDATRAELAHHVRGARRRALNAESFLGVALGALVLGYATWRIARGIGGTAPSDTLPGGTTDGEGAS